MADMLIYWNEIQEAEFPDCCMTCGCDDTDLVPRYLETRPWVGGLIGLMLRRSMTVELPFCPAHQSRPWFAWGRTDARAFTDDGIWMKNLSPVFVDEMEAFREEEEDYENRRRRKKHKRKGKKRSRDYDEDDREPFDDRPRRRPQPSSGGGGMTALIVIMLVVGVPVVLLGGCCVASIVLNGGNIQVNKGGPPFNNRPNPQFNPPFNRKR
jgi:hypothetical protein